MIPPLPLNRIILIPLALGITLGLASCGGDEEIDRVDAEYEIQQRAQIDAAIIDLKTLRAHPKRALIVRESIDRYLRARRQAKRFNEEIAIEGGDGAPIAAPAVIADDEVLGPAKKEVPSLFGPNGKSIVPEDLRQFRKNAANDFASALRPAAAGPAELLTARASRYGLDATYPDSDGLTRRELITGAASAVESYWPGLAAGLEGAVEEPN